MDRFKLFDNFYCLSKDDRNLAVLSRNGLRLPVHKILLREETVIKRNGENYFFSPFDVLRLSNSLDLVYPFFTIHDLLNRLESFQKLGKSGISMKDFISDYRIEQICTY